MTQEQKIIRAKVGLLELAKQLGNSLPQRKLTFANPDSQVTPNNAAILQPAWTYATRDAVSASPAVVDGVLYDGSWDGFFFALNSQTGALKWRIQLDCQTSIVPLPEVCGGPPPPWISGVPDLARYKTAGGIVTASPAVVEDSVYFSGGKTLYAARHSIRSKRQTERSFGNAFFAAIRRNRIVQPTRRIPPKS